MKIRNAQGRTDGNSGYSRVFDNEKLGQLLSKVQATVISNGTELERMIEERSNTIKNLDDFIDAVTDGNIDDGVYLCQKKIIKKSSYAIKGIEPDLLIFVVQRKRICKVVELKDGDAFDTKKAQGEKEHLEQFSKEFGAKIPFVTDYYMCCFNQEDKEKICEGFKGEFDLNHVMTGKELCDILKINYAEIVKVRRQDAKDNFEYFLNELLKIKEIKKFCEEFQNAD